MVCVWRIPRFFFFGRFCSRGWTHLGFVGSHFLAYLLAGIASGRLVNVFVDGWMDDVI